MSGNDDKKGKVGNNNKRKKAAKGSERNKSDNRNLTLRRKKMKLSILLAGSILTSAIVGNVYAQTCGAQPSCSDLGYSYTGSTSDCVGPALKCPFNTSYFNCVKKADALAKLQADIVTAAMPNYSKREHRLNNIEYIAQTNGFIFGYDQGQCDAGNHSCENAQNYQIIIDGINVRITNKALNWAHNTWAYPVKKGSSYRFSNTPYITYVYYFVPTI